MTVINKVLKLNAFGWEEVKVIAIGGQAKIVLYRDLNPSSNRQYIGKQALKREYIQDIKNEHKILSKIIHSGFQYAEYEDRSGPGGYTSYRRYCPGEPLSELIKRNPKFFCNPFESEKNFLSFSLNLANLIHHLHTEHNIAHLDIKPENILCGSYNEISLIDLGIAQKIGKKGTGKGSHNWMHPDQKIPGTEIIPDFDLYSFSKVILYSLNLIPKQHITGNADLNSLEGKVLPQWLIKNQKAMKFINICKEGVKHLKFQKLEYILRILKDANSAGYRRKKSKNKCINPQCESLIFPNQPVCFKCLTPLIKEPPSVICSYCGREIPEKSFSLHIKQNHPDIRNNNNNFECKICHWATSDGDLWYEHKKVCKSDDYLISSSNLNLSSFPKFQIFNDKKENPKSLHAISLSGIKYETLEVYRSLNINFFDHQEDTVIRALRDLGGRCIIADGVGLGKTIECGIILRELLFRESINSVLVVVPNYELQCQWIDELEDKFELGSKDPKGFNYWRHGDPCPKPGDKLIVDIFSLNAKRIHPNSEKSIPSHLIKSLGYKEKITDKDLFINNIINWDLIIIDEAHELGINPNGLRWKRIYELNPKYLLLVTATPMKRSPVDLYPMIKAIDPIAIGNYREFINSYSEKNATHQDFQRLKALLSQVMIRHTRGDVHSFNFPRRKAIIHFVKYNTLIKKIHDCIISMVRSSNPKIQKDGYFLYKKLCHSVVDFINWFKENYSNLVNNNHLNTLSKILETKKEKWQLEDDPKVQSLFNIIEEINDNYDKYFSSNIFNTDEGKSNKSPIIVFSGSNHTRDIIREVLQKKFRYKLNVEGFTSNMDGRKRQELLNTFNSGEIDILVCGTSQSRGLNLQKGNVLINLDLPNNPVEIEQRIGRVERLEQKKALVFIINIMYDTELERKRWEMYKNHLIMFQEVVGDTDLVNLFTSVDIVDEVDNLNKAIVEGIKTHKEIEESFKKLNRNIRKTDELQNNILRRESDDDELI